MDWLGGRLMETAPFGQFDDAAPIVGDAYRQPARWTCGDDLGVKPDEAICLRFRLNRAKLYWVDFEWRWPYARLLQSRGALAGFAPATNRRKRR